MRKLILAALVAGLAMPAGADERTIVEYFSSPTSAQGLLSPNLFRVHAVKIQANGKTEWKMKFKLAFGGMVSNLETYFFYLTLDEARRMLSLCKHYLNYSQEAQKSKADAYEERVAISEGFELVYRMNISDGKGEEYWLTKKGELNAQRALVLDKGAFEGLVRSLAIALEKAAANQ